MLVPHFLVLLVPNVLNLERKTGLEPATSTLARWRSTIEPLPHIIISTFFINLLYFKMERVVGIEPTFPAWKAGVLADIRYPHIFKSLLTSYYCVNFVTVLLTYAI